LNAQTEEDEGRKANGDIRAAATQQLLDARVTRGSTGARHLLFGIML
jgi:hypothetical protein